MDADLTTWLRVLEDSMTYDAGSFYGATAERGVGRGMLHRVPYALYNPDTTVFDTVRGLVYVLTHECDVDEENTGRFANTDVLVCPILPAEIMVPDYRSSAGSDDRLRGFLHHLARNNIQRLLYLPPFPPAIPYGGVLNLNLISSTRVEFFGEQTFAGAVSEYGLMIADYKFENHLLRPKDDRLARFH